MNILSYDLHLIRSIKIKPFFLLGLFVLVVISAQLINSANMKLQELIMSREGLTPEIWVYACIQIVLTFVTEAFIFMMAAQALSSFQTPLAFWRHLNQFLIESIRSWGKILLGLICFIIPGLILFLRYLLVPFVVVYDPRYDQGKVDALEQSHRLYSALSILQWGMLLILKLAIPVGISVLFEDINELQDGTWLFLLRQLLEVFSLLLFIIMMKRFLESTLHPLTQEKAEV